VTAADLHEMFITTLLREAGGNRRHWRLALGQVKVYGVDTHPHCNWAVSPSGTLRDLTEIERVADRLRERYPVIAAK
jgi:hypothetical protein